jgi:plasmid stabilization system protein ParE
MDYDVQLTEDAEQDLDRYVKYLLFVKKNEQAANNLLNDFEATINSLKQVADSLNYCENKGLRELGYRRINFLSHRYFMLYRIDGDIAVVDNIFHELQDFENKLI